MSKSLIAVGSNLPFGNDSPIVTLGQAIADLHHTVGVIRAVSRFFSTPCFPAGSGPDYVNAAVLIQTELDPAAVLDQLHIVELRYGRERVQRWGQRTLDLDLINHGEKVLPDLNTYARWVGLDPERQKTDMPDRLILPHPRLQDRAFVLGPLADIARDWVHPVTGRRVAEMLAELPEADRTALRAL